MFFVLTMGRGSKNTKKNKLKLKKKDIETLDGEIQAQFTSTEEKIKDLPEVIQQRHRDFVKHYKDNLRKLKKNLDAIDKAKTDTEIDTEIEAAKEFLRKVKPPKKHISLDPNKLPNRNPEEKEVKFEERKFEPKKLKLPKLRKKKAGIGEDEFLEDFFVEEENDSYPEPFMVASAGSLNNLFAQAEGEPAPKHTPPTDADLAETVEIQFTPAIIAKAEELEQNPVKIYNWVKNNIEFVPTYGSIQGADMCLKTKLCNAFDTASLTIALLRASNIHARYVTGTVEIPMDRFMNWAGGFTDPMSALSLFASSGIPITGMTVGGEIKYAKLEHIWVEAWIDYFPSRGARHKTGEGDLWVRMDTSFKQYNYTEGIDIQSTLPFDAQTFIEQIIASATINEVEGYITNVDSSFIEQTIDDYRIQVENYMTQNYPDATYEDVLGKKEIITKEYPFIPGTLQFRTISRDAIYVEIPSNLRHKISFKVVKDMHDELIGMPINISMGLPEIAGKKITLSYSAATPGDEAVVNSYLPEPHPDGSPIDPSELPSSLPAYLINVKPEVRVDGSVIATGTSVGLGQKSTFTMTFISPKTPSDVINNEITAGEYFGIAIDNGRIPQAQIQMLKTKIETTKMKLETGAVTDLTKDDIVGDLLYATALAYYAELDIMDYVQAKIKGVISIRLPSEAHFSTDISVYSIFDVPMSISSGGFAMDVDRSLAIVKSLDGDLDKPKQFFRLSGSNGSALEYSVPEQLFSTPENPAEGISAVKALHIANNQEIPIYSVNKETISTVLPQLQVDGETITDIRNAVNAGMEVTVQKSDITFNGWTGHGYIIINPKTGAGAYMIAGGKNGAVILGTFFFILVFIFVLLAIACAGLTGPGALLCIGVMIYHAFLAFIAGIIAFYGKAKLDEFMNCIATVLGSEAITRGIEYITPLLVLKIFFAFLSGYGIGNCIEKTFYDWDKIYDTLEI